MLQWADNFEGYGDLESLMLSGLYATVNGQVVTSPDGVGKAFACNTLGASETQVLRKVLPAAVTTLGAACRIWLDNLPPFPSVSAGIFTFADGSNYWAFSLWVTTTGALQVRRDATTIENGTLVAASAGPVLVATSFQHIEMKAFCSTTVGAVEVRVDGVTVITATGVNTQGSGDGTYAQVFQTQDASGSGFQIGVWIKDYVLWDTTGAYNVDFLGSVSVVSLVPDSDVDLTWTPNAGSTGYTILDNDPPLVGSYISALDPPPAPSVFGLSDLPEDTTSVKGMLVIYRAVKTDGGDANVQTGLISGVDTDLGVDRPVTTTFTYWFDVSETDPATSAPWTPAAVNAAQLQLDRTV